MMMNPHKGSTAISTTTDEKSMELAVNHLCYDASHMAPGPLEAETTLNYIKNIANYQKRKMTAHSDHFLILPSDFDL